MFVRQALHQLSHLPKHNWNIKSQLEGGRHGVIISLGVGGGHAISPLSDAVPSRQECLHRLSHGTQTLGAFTGLVLQASISGSCTTVKNYCAQDMIPGQPALQRETLSQGEGREQRKEERNKGKGKGRNHCDLQNKVPPGGPGTEWASVCPALRFTWLLLITLLWASQRVTGRPESPFQNIVPPNL